MTIKPLTATRVDEVLARLGFDERPRVDADGLAAIYRTWGRRVPFDNLRKLVAMHHSLPEIPGVDPADFFAAWQLTGAGSTCWGTNTALHSLLVGAGFDARMFAASMGDGEINHGTTIVTLGPTRWLVDTAVHSDVPLPLVDGVPARVDHCGYVTEVRPDPDGWVMWCATADPALTLPCRIHGELDHPFVEAANERSRDWSPFNDGVMAQINDAEGTWLLKGGRLTRIDEAGTASSDLTDAEVDRFLVETMRHSPQLVAEVRGVLVAQAEARDDP